MAEGFEPFHVPQQSRRDKLRVILQENPSCEETAVSTNTLHGFSGLFPPYDPSLLSSSMLTCANEVPYQFHHQNTMFGEAGEPSKQNPVSTVKEEGLNLMGCVAGFMNAPASFTNPNGSIQHIDNNDKNNINPFLYASQNPRNFVPLTQNYTTTGQSLSLSLSSQNLQEHDSSEIGEKGIGEYVVRRIFGGGASTSTNFSRSLVPFGPFTGYATILKGSRFLKPAQLLLEELCDVGRGIYADRSSVYSSAMESPVSPEILAGTGTAEDSLASGDYGKHRKKTTTTLLSMLDEVYRRYRQYYQQMQAVATSFESVAGLANAAPYTSFALKAMSKHFKCLKNAITDQLRFTSKGLGEGSFRKDENPSFGTFDRDHSQRPIHSSGILEQHVWRPQRGLPERAVAMLRAWLFEHFLHPYPTDTDKQMLAKQTGLSRNQVSNWFINARVRLWKPMVEEIHMLETRQALKDQEPDDRRANEPSDNLPPENLISPPNPTLTTSHTQDPPLKRSRNELSFIPGRSSELPANFSYTTSSSGNNGVSLALGLHQNNGIVFSEPFSMNIAQRFGLETHNEGYNVGSLEAQNAHFGKDIRGQLLRDFVGQ